MGVRRLSESARVALEFTDGDESDELTVATILTERTDMILRLLHDKPDAVRKAVASGLSDLKAVSYARCEYKRLSRSATAMCLRSQRVQFGHMRTTTGTRTSCRWSALSATELAHVLNALLHQLIPDAAGGEVPKLTLSLRPLMAMPIEEGHRELSDAGVPECEDLLAPEETEDVTSPELGGIGMGPSTNQVTVDSELSGETQGAGPESHSEGDGASPPASPEGPSQHSGAETEPGVSPRRPTPLRNMAHHVGSAVKVVNPQGPAGGAAPPGTGGPGVAGAGATNSRPRHKVQRDKRLLSYVNHGTGDDAEGDGGSSSTTWQSRQLRGRR